MMKPHSMWPTLASISQWQCFRNSRNESFEAIQEFIWTLFRISPRFLRFESRRRHRCRHRHRRRNRPITRPPIFLSTATRKIVSPWFFVQKKVPNFFELLSLKKREKMGRSNFVFILVFAGSLALVGAHVNVSQGSVLSFTQILLVMVASGLEVA